MSKEIYVAFVHVPGKVGFYEVTSVNAFTTPLRFPNVSEAQRATEAFIAHPSYAGRFANGYVARIMHEGTDEIVSVGRKPAPPTVAWQDVVAYD